MIKRKTSSPNLKTKTDKQNPVATNSTANAVILKKKTLLNPNGKTKTNSSTVNILNRLPNPITPKGLMIPLPISKKASLASSPRQKRGQTIS